METYCVETLKRHYAARHPYGKERDACRWAGIAIVADGYHGATRTLDVYHIQGLIDAVGVYSDSGLWTYISKDSKGLFFPNPYQDLYKEGEK